MSGREGGRCVPGWSTLRLFPRSPTVRKYCPPSSRESGQRCCRPPLLRKCDVPHLRSVLRACKAASVLEMEWYANRNYRRGQSGPGNPHPSIGVCHRSSMRKCDAPRTQNPVQPQWLYWPLPAIQVEQVLACFATSCCLYLVSPHRHVPNTSLWSHPILRKCGHGRPVLRRPNTRSRLETRGRTDSSGSQGWACHRPIRLCHLSQW